MTVFNSTPLERKLSVLLGHPAERRRSGARRTSARSREAARSSARPAWRCRRASRTCAREDDIVAALDDLRRARARDPPRGRQARRQLLGRRQRPLSLPRGRRARRPARRAARISPSRVATETRTRVISASSPRWAGSSRSSSSIPESALAIGPAAHRPARRGRAALDPRPDPRRPFEPGLPGLPVSRRQTPYRRAIQEAAREVGRRPRAAAASSAASASTSSSAGGRAASLGGLRPRDQPAHGRHDAPVPRAAVPDGRQARPRVGRVPFPGRPSQVLPLDRQPEVRRLPRPLSRGPHRHPDDEPAPLQPRARRPAPSST